MKNCKDCKYVKLSPIASKNNPTEFAKCTSPKTTNKYTFCEVQRNNIWPRDIFLNTCGKRGRHWEKK